MTYGLDPSFERWCVALAATRKTFWLRVGRRMDPNELGVGPHKELQKVSLLVAKDHGWPTFELVLQRATSLLHEGSLPAQSLYDLVEILQTDVTALDQDQVIRELVPPVRKQWQQALNRKILHAYANSSPYGSLVQEMEECDRLGEPVADVDAASTELGEDTEQVLAEAPLVRRVPTGIGPLDAALRGGWVFGDVATICGDSKTGKCHERGQGILLFDGTTRKVEEIRVGDRLMGPDGKPRTVLSTNSGSGEMYEIRPRRGKPWRVNKEHILTIALVKKNGGQPWDWKTLDVSVEEWMKWPAHKRRNSYLTRPDLVEFDRPESPLPLEPYFLGVYLGDGTTRGASSGAGITVADSDIVVEICRQADALGLHVTVSNKDRTAPTYWLSGRPTSRKDSNPVTKAIRELGLHRRSSGEKFIPDAYKYAPSAARWELLAGLIDTDGSLTKVAFDYVSKSERLAEDVAFVARSLGLSAYVKKCRKGCQTGAVGTYYRVSIGGDTWKVPTRVPRKKAGAYKRKGYDTRRSAFEVIPSGEVRDYFGFTLDGDARYLLDDFTITHNSMSLSFFGAVGALYGENVGYLALEDQNSTYHARFLAAITGVPIFDLEHPEFRQEARDIWKRLRDKGGVGRVIIDTFQPGSLDPRQVSAWFARKEKEYGIRIRFRIVDYGDLIRSPHKADQESKYTHGETIWRALAAMAMENPDDPNIVLTATQSKRQEFKPGQPIPMLTRKDVADSIHKVRLSHLFLTLTPQPDMSASGGYIWYIDADRRNNATGTVLGPIAHQRWLGRMADLSHLG